MTFWFVCLIPLIEDREFLPQLIIYLFKDILGSVELFLCLSGELNTDVFFQRSH